MFWGNISSDQCNAQAYADLLTLAKYVDDHRYAGVWIPERHFHPWGGMHPNPSVFGAAIASVTKHVKIRAGSVVLPLHEPLRVAEEWAVVDNLSRGRVELAIATGWRSDDFVIAPANFKSRRSDIWDSIEELKRLWRGESVQRVNERGESVNVRTYPAPVQRNIPLWVTSAGSLRTITDAGGNGFNLLTHLLGQTYETLAVKVGQYNAYRTRTGHRGPGEIALMLHTFLGRDREEVRRTTKLAMSSYLLNSADIIIPSNQRPVWESADKELKNQMIEVAFDRYFDTGSLMGTLDSCKSVVRRVHDIGVTEICCLIDFGVSLDLVLDSMDILSQLKSWAEAGCP